MGPADDPPARVWSARDLAEFRPHILLGILPIAVFWSVRQVAETPVAIGAGFAAALLVFAVNRQRGTIGYLALAGMVVVGGASLAGIVLDSDKAFLANDAVGDFVAMFAFAGSVLIGRPLLGVLVCEVFPRLSSVLGPRHPVFVRLSLLWAVQNLLTGVVRVVMLQEFSTDEYILFSRAVSWPLGLGLFAVSSFLIARAVRERVLAAQTGDGSG